MDDGKNKAVTEAVRESGLVRFNPSGELVVIGCMNDQVCIWDWQNRGARPIKVTIPTFTTTEIACDHNVVYTCTRHDEVYIVDPASLEVTRISQGPNTCCTSMVILPHGEAILAGIVTSNSFIYWEMSTRREIRHDTGHSRDSIVTAIDITSDGKLALSGSSSGTISLVNLESFQVVQTFASTRPEGVGIRLVSVLGNDASFVVVDEENTAELRSFSNFNDAKVLGKPSVKLNCVTPLGSKYILFGCENGELLLFNYFDMVEPYKHKAHDEAVTQVESHPQDEFLYFASGSKNGTVKLWYVTETAPPVWSQIRSYEKVHSHPITALAFLPGSNDIVCGSYGDDVHRLSGAAVARTYWYKSYGNTALRVVGDTLIAARMHAFSVAMWNLNDAQLTKRLHSGVSREQVTCAHLGADYVVSKGSHHSLLLWDLKTGATIHRLLGHTHDVRALAFVPGGEFLLSGSRDRTLKLWDLRTGRFLEEFHFERYALTIACAPDGTICVGLQGGQVCFLRVNNLPSSTTSEL